MILHYYSNKFSKTVILSGVLLGGPLIAQDADTPDVGDPVYELSPFEVVTTNDRGYYAANSTAGTSLNARIRDIPINLNVITTEFIEDLQASDMKESLSYEAGIFLNTFENNTSANAESQLEDRSPSSNVNVNDPFANTIVIRGYSVPNQQRLGFRVGANISKYGVTLGGFTDSANTERLEVVKGPQSLLYGINVLSGVVNILPKRPLSEMRTSLSLAGGSDQYLRMTFDNTGPVIKGQLDYRIAMSHTEQGHWTDYRSDERDYGVLQFDYHPAKWVSLFVEAQFGSSIRKGGGTQFFTDTAGNDSTFLNPYGERYTFGYDFFNLDRIEGDGFNELSQTIYDVNGELAEGNTKLVEKTGKTYAFPKLGDQYRISGPDVFREQDEYDLLALLNLQPTDKLDIQLGAYYTDVEVNARNLSMGVVNNSSQSLVEGKGLLFNPEIDTDDVFSDGLTKAYGIGEFFQAYNPFYDSSSNILNKDLKFARYMWYESPTSSNSIQLRARVAYTTETNWFSGLIRGRHTFSAGINYIKDEVAFVFGGPGINAAYSAKGSTNSGWTESKFNEDPMHLRSVFDYSVIRYEKDALAIPGYISFSDIGSLGALDTVDQYVARSGWKEADLTFKGLYGVYYGRFFDERLHVMAGVRQDSYQVLEKEQLRILDPLQESESWVGTSPSLLDELIGYGDKPYTWRQHLPDYINEGVEANIAQLMAEQPKGTQDYMFDEDEKYTTATFGTSFHVTDDLSVFFNYAEGIFPNSGQRDGSYRAIEAEQTVSKEIGIKFEMLDGRLSGTLGAYLIKRKNAVFDWFWAPNPSKWGGGPLDYSGTAVFRPDEVRSGDQTIKYGVSEYYVQAAFEEMGLEIPTRRGQVDVGTLQKSYPEVLVVSTVPTSNQIDTSEEGTYYFVDYKKMKETVNSPFVRAFDTAVSDGGKSFGMGGLPIQYFASNDTTMSATRHFGANVLYEEKGVGVDGSLIFTPWNDNRYQVIFGYSYTDREVVGSGFKLAPGYQIDSAGRQVGDELFTTEYDMWVLLLGPENFDDPRNPATLKSSAVKGVDLSFVPDWNLTLWNKYSFQDGPLDGLSIGAGVRWNSSIQTTAGIGGDRIQENLYPTPDVPSRFVCDLSLSYRRELWGSDWTVSLRIANLLDDDIGQDIVTYSDDAGHSIQRRTRVLYDPLSFRLALTTDF